MSEPPSTADGGPRGVIHRSCGARSIGARRTQTLVIYTPLDVVTARNGGFFTRADALACDWTDRELAAALKDGVISRLRHGAYAFTVSTVDLDDVARHLLIARAVIRQQRGRVALTGVSAAAAHGLTLWGQDLSDVHVVRLDRGSPRRELGVRHHRVADGAAVEVEELAGLLVVSIARTVWEVASTSNPGGWGLYRRLRSAPVPAGDRRHPRPG